MNQEGYFEKALKMRNALQEFAKKQGPLSTTILGLREQIVTSSVGSLKKYMALQKNIIRYSMSKISHKITSD